MSTPEPQVDFSDLTQWKTFDEIQELLPHFKKTTLNWLMRRKETNGLDKIVKKVGRFNMIHKGGFSLWISQQ